MSRVARRTAHRLRRRLGARVAGEVAAGRGAGHDHRPAGTAHDRGGLRRYVAELAASGVQALGLGLGAELPYQEAPDALVAAASSVGMPLLTVPDGVPFIAVTKAVFAMQAAEERRELEWALQSQRAMTEAAVNPGGLASILESHHRATDVGAAVVDLGGRVLASFGCDGDDLALASATLVESIRDRGLDVAAADTQHGVRLEVTHSAHDGFGAGC